MTKKVMRPVKRPQVDEVMKSVRRRRAAERPWAVKGTRNGVSQPRHSVRSESLLVEYPELRHERRARLRLTVLDVSRPIRAKQFPRLATRTPKPFARHARITQRVRIEERRPPRQDRKHGCERRQRGEERRESRGLEDAAEGPEDGREGRKDGDEERGGDDSAEGRAGRAGCASAKHDEAGSRLCVSCRSRTDNPGEEVQCERSHSSTTRVRKTHR